MLNVVLFGKTAGQNAGNMQEEAVSEKATEPPDNDLIDFYENRYIRV